VLQSEQNCEQISCHLCARTCKSLQITLDLSPYICKN
jgi:hypothetical protein